MDEKIPENEPIPENSGFHFDSKETELLLKASPVGYPGTATSEFQQGQRGGKSDSSEWGRLVRENIAGEESPIRGRLSLSELPDFDAKKEKYLDRSAELGDKMFRISMEMARLCPRAGEFSEEEMAENVKTLALSRMRGQEPMVTMHHFTMPDYLVEYDKGGGIKSGGWENPEVAKHFRFYIESVTRFLGDDDKMRSVLDSLNLSEDNRDRFLSEGVVKYFMPINEPMTTLCNGYVSGVFPPFKRGNVIAAKKVLDRMVEMSELSYDELKKLGRKVPESREPQIGNSYNWQYFDGLFGEAAHYVSNTLITDPFERDGAHSDFLGLQYYFRQTCPLIGKDPSREHGDHPAFGDMYPPGIYEVLKRMNERYPNKEIFITEFGFADNDDMRRPYWILETVRYVIEAVKSGVPVKGLLLWSMVENLEWAEGMETKFGIMKESDLDKPLIPSTEGVRSWEVWQATTKALASPSEQSLAALQAIYEKAKAQFGASRKNS